MDVIVSARCYPWYLDTAFIPVNWPKENPKRIWDLLPAHRNEWREPRSGDHRIDICTDLEYGFCEV